MFVYEYLCFLASTVKLDGILRYIVLSIDSVLSTVNPLGQRHSHIPHKQDVRLRYSRIAQIIALFCAYNYSPETQNIATLFIGNNYYIDENSTGNCLRIGRDPAN